MGRIIARVTEEERDQIKKLHARKTALKELMPGLASTTDTDSARILYERLVADMGETSIAFEKWWTDMATKYKWEKLPQAHWRIDFDTGDISLEARE